MSQDIVVGIDLGTTNSAIASINEQGVPDVLADPQGYRTTPSVVQIRPDGTTLVGREAKREIVLEKENTVQFFKRDMGTAMTSDYRGRAWTPVDLSAEVLKKLKADGEAALNGPVCRAVITVPAYFQEAPRRATQEAGALAGLEVVQIINEPTAAAIAYGLNKGSREETVLVYDLGGGTFDVTLVHVHPDRLEVLGTDGNHQLGGKDWDDRLLTYACEEFKRRHHIDINDDPYAFQELLVRAEDAKKALSRVEKSVVAVNCGGRMDRIEITMAQFEEMTRDLLAQTETLVGQVLTDAHVGWDRIGSILMVGGSTRMPMCKALVSRLSGKPPNTGVNPDECVALGAAIQGSLYGERKVKRASGLAFRRDTVRDVTSHSLGMIALNATGDRYLNSILVPKNKPIPCREERPYQTRPSSGGAATSVYVTQGESDDPRQCTFVGKYAIQGIPPGKSGVAVVDVAYSYDVNGVVGVSARDRASGTELTVTKEPLPEDMSWVLEPPKKEAPRHKRVLIAVDLSGSMSDEPLADAQKALQQFLAQSDLSTTSIGLIAFADQTLTTLEPVQDGKEILRANEALSVGMVGWGNATHPFNEILKLHKGVDGPRYAIVLTDGMWSNQREAEERAKACQAAGIEIIAVGFGTADKDFLGRIANSTEAAVFATDLSSTFRDIAQVMVETEGGSLAKGLGLRWKG